MRNSIVGALVIALALPAAAFAAGHAPHTYASKYGRPLTLPSHRTPTEVAIGFLRDRGLGAAEVASLRTASESRAPTSGLTHVILEQQVGGRAIHGAYVKATVDDMGQLVHLIDRMVAVPSQNLIPARIGADQATRAAVAFLYPKGATFYRAPSVERVAVATANGFEEAYVVETWSLAQNRLNETLVGGGGQVISTELRTNDDRYNVFTENPLVTPQTGVAGPGAGNAESPSGWLGSGRQTTQDIAGNNVHAYLDINADNAPDGTGSAVTNGRFMTGADLTQTPANDRNRNVAVQNLFYLANVIHDTLYRAGFDEAAGNFQVSNFGNGGRGGDPVNAEAQDGSGTDNANFATPKDGSSPRMQMYLWTGKGINQVAVDAPTGVAGSYRAQGATFGAAPTVSGVTANILLVNDGAGTTSDACEALPAGSLAGAIALMNRGSCAFVVKAKNAQNAGAVAAIVANNVNGDSIITMGGTDATITIPAVFISQNDGAKLEAVTGLHGTVRKTDPPPLQRDGDIDSDIVFHESGHGLTWRMIGRMDGPMAGAIGEGMSDVLAEVMDGDDRMGEYAFDDPLGIRTFPYTNYPRTYGDVAGSEVHFDGEVYGAIGWLLLQNIPDRDLLLSYLVDGMNYTPAQPTFEEMRDGILQAVANSGSGDECLIWDAFAHYGVGVGARGQVQGKTVVVSESFALPPECTP